MDAKQSKVLKLTTDEYKQLFLLAHRLAQQHDLDPDDLLQEAFLRIAERRRRQPNDVELVTFVWGVMKSIASHSHKSASKHKEINISSLVRVGSQDENLIVLRDILSYASKPNGFDWFDAVRQYPHVREIVRNIIKNNLNCKKSEEYFRVWLEVEVLGEKTTAKARARRLGVNTRDERTRSKTYRRRLKERRASIKAELDRWADELSAFYELQNTGDVIHLQLRTTETK